VEETITQKGVYNNEEVDKLKSKLEDKKIKAQQAEKVLQKYQDTINRQDDDDAPIKRLYNEVVKGEILTVQDIAMPEMDNRPVFRTDKLSKLTKDQRKMISKVFDIINKVLDKERAEMVIQKIEDEFK
jgi:molecular chaperone HtpG